MAAVEAQNLLKRPNKLKSLPEKRDQEKYCRFHRDHGHNTEDYFRLKIAIKKLIKRGHLAEFVTVATATLRKHQRRVQRNIGGRGFTVGPQETCPSVASRYRACPVANHLPSDTLTFSASDIQDSTTHTMTL